MAADVRPQHWDGPNVFPAVIDLLDADGTRAWADGVAAEHGAVDGLIHLVGGWRGAKGIADQPDEDWDFLERNAVTTLRNVSRAFYADLAASGTGRRKARVASVDRIFLAHASSSEAAAGVQVKSRRRLGVSPGPVTLCGPVIVICVTPGVRASM